MNDPPPNPPPLRLRSLDSVRGIAALIVVFFHASMVLPATQPGSLPWLYHTPLRLLVAGPAAVILFFVLSGMVLAIPYSDHDIPNIPAFLIKRLTRIWLPFAASIIVAIVLAAMLGAAPLGGLSAWFNHSWSDPLSFSILINTFLMTGKSVTLNNPMWSLIYEIRASIFFPLLLISTRRLPLLTLLGTATLTIMAAKIMGLFPSFGIFEQFVRTISYCVMFVTGILLAIFSRPIRCYISTLPRYTIGLLWLIALVGLSFAPEYTGDINRVRDALLVLVNTFAAALLLLLSIVEGRAMFVLMGQIPVFLGRISYSLYLVHVIVIVGVVRCTWGSISPPVAIIAGIGLSIVAATGFERFIERPSGAWGRRLAARYDKRQLAVGSVKSGSVELKP